MKKRAVQPKGIGLGLLGMAALWWLSGCGGGGAGPVPPGPQNAEPTGGSWRAILILQGAVALTVPPPPAAGSAQEGAELAELRALQSGRTAAQEATALFWNAGACVRWNEIARARVISGRTSPPHASRIYAALSVAQYDALVACWNAKYRARRAAPHAKDASIVPLFTTSNDPVYPSEHAVVAGASAAILAFFDPAEAANFAAKAREHQESRLIAGVNFRSDIEAGDALGRAVAQKVIERLQTDGAANAGTGPAQSVGPGFWNGTNPVLPGWGRVKPWLAPDMRPFSPPPPPAFGSAQFNAALAEVRQISDTRTAEQLQIAQFWADAAGSFTPPGHWNLIACDLLLAHHLNELRAARCLALMNMAQMDAGICCWDTKFTYWTMRPSQVDPAITLPIGLPNFPSYTSGHSSFSGASATVLAYVFPGEAAQLSDWAQEASVSRVYGGIHYRFDCEAGVANGQRIGALAVTRGQLDGSPPSSPASVGRGAAQWRQLTKRNLRPGATRGSASTPVWD